MKNTKRSSQAKPENISARAFKHGTQGVGIEHFVKEIDADFEGRRQALNAASTENINRLDAAAVIADKRKIDAESRWRMIDDLHEGRRPEIGKPVVAVAVAVTMIVAEGVLLAPTMDGLNITESWAQIVVATVMVGALSGLLEIAVHNFNKVPRKLWIVISSAAFAIASLGVFGWWRAEEVIFAGSLTGGSSFAADNAMLTRVLMILVTVALPVTAAFLLDFGFRKIRVWLERQKAKSDFQRFTQQAEETEKALTAAREKRDAELEAIGQEKASWQEAVRDNFEKGRAIGAWKLPFWQAVILPTLVAALLLFVVIFLPGVAVAVVGGIVLLDPLALTALLFLWLGLTGLFAIHFIRKWNRPTDEELFHQQIVTHWRNAPEPNSIRLAEAGIDRSDRQLLPTSERQGLRTAPVAVAAGVTT